MNDMTKIILLVLIMLYVVSPIDLCPGPIDDLIVVLLGWAGQKGLSQITTNKSDVDTIDS